MERFNGIPMEIFRLGHPISLPFEPSAEVNNKGIQHLWIKVCFFFFFFFYFLFITSAMTSTSRLFNVT